MDTAVVLLPFSKLFLQVISPFRLSPGLLQCQHSLQILHKQSGEVEFAFYFLSMLCFHIVVTVAEYPVSSQCVMIRDINKHVFVTPLPLVVLFMYIYVLICIYFL